MAKTKAETERRYQSHEELTSALKGDVRRAFVYLAHPLHILKVLAYVILAAVQMIVLWWACHPVTIPAADPKDSFAARYPLVSSARNYFAAMSLMQWLFLLGTLSALALAVFLFFRGHEKRYGVKIAVLLVYVAAICFAVGNVLTALCLFSLTILQIAFDIFHHVQWRRTHPSAKETALPEELSPSVQEIEPLFVDRAE